MPNKKTALVLPGAGARGRGQAGMLKAVDESRLYCDMVFGTSSGGLNGALYHQGDLSLLLSLWMCIENKDVYAKRFWRGFGKDGYFYDTAPLRKLLAGLVKPAAMKANPRPFFVSATDTATSSAITFEVGKLDANEMHMALLASASLPILFPATYLQGRRLVDGGIAYNYPLIRAIDAGAKRLVVLVPTEPAKSTFNNLLDNFESLIELFQAGSFQLELDAVQELSERDPEIELILIAPKAGEPCGVLDFSLPQSKRKQIIDNGYALARTGLLDHDLWAPVKRLVSVPR